MSHDSTSQTVLPPLSDEPYGMQIVLHPQDGLTTVLARVSGVCSQDARLEASYTRACQGYPVT